MTSGVYAIKNTFTLKVYVGSSVSVERRRRTHFRDLKNGAHHSVKLQRSWNKHGAEAFIFEVLEAAPKGSLMLREQHWIDALCAAGNGYNVNPAANSVGALPKTEAHKRHIGDARRGQKHSPEVRLLLSELAKTRTPRQHTAEEHERSAAKHRGQRRSAEQKAALSVARTGVKLGPQTAEHRAAIAAARRGKPLSEHHKQRIREGQAAKRAKAGEVHAH